MKPVFICCVVSCYSFVFGCNCHPPSASFLCGMDTYANCQHLVSS